MDLEKKMVVEKERMSDHTAEGCAEAEQAERTEQVEAQMMEWATPFLEHRAAEEYYYLKEEEVAAYF